MYLLLAKYKVIVVYTSESINTLLLNAQRQAVWRFSVVSRFKTVITAKNSQNKLCLSL